jgi:hypothetical protein
MAKKNGRQNALAYNGASSSNRPNINQNQNRSQTQLIKLVRRIVREEMRSNGRDPPATDLQHHNVVTVVDQTASQAVVFDEPVGPLTPVFTEYMSATAGFHDKYRFVKLQFRWIPSCAKTTSGQICMYFDPDVKDLAVTEFQDAADQGYSEFGPVYEPLTLNVPRRFIDSIRDALYVETDQASEALKRYFGRFVALSSGGTVLNSVGRIEVHYDIEFYCPNITSKFPANFTAYKTRAPGIALAPATPVFYGSPAMPTNHTDVNDIGLEPDSNGAYTLPKGTWELVFNYAASALAAGDTISVALDIAGATVNNWSYTNPHAYAKNHSQAYSWIVKSDGSTTFAWSVASALGVALLGEFVKAVALA